MAYTEIYVSADAIEDEGDGSESNPLTLAEAFDLPGSVQIWLNEIQE